MKIFAIVAGLILVAIIIFVVIHKVTPVGWGMWGKVETQNGVALQGFDPVSYFVANEPVPGSPDNNFKWRDATWHFATSANRDAFVANPEKFAPQYGGFCSFAVSKGFTAKASPDAWYIHDGRLYVFADEKVRQTFVDEIDGGILEKSEINWRKR